MFLHTTIIMGRTHEVNFNKNRLKGFHGNQFSHGDQDSCLHVSVEVAISFACIL